jgi:RNA polymerase sigma-70 factor (ECF subfamily)
MTDRDNLTWVADLREPGERREASLADLDAKLQPALKRGLSRWLSPNHPEFNDLVQDIAQETLMRVLKQLDTFEGKGQFTNWVYKISVRLALNELRKRKWRNVSLDFLQESGEEGGAPFEFPASDPLPEENLQRSQAMQVVMRAITEELTAKQRSVMMAVIVQGVPMDVVAERLGSTRNAVYKMLHDARRRLKSRLEETGLAPGDLLAMFE